MHRFYSFLLLSLAAGIVAAQPSEEAVKKELKLFQGKWAAVSGQNIDGVALTDGELLAMSLDVDGEKFVLKTGSLTVEGIFKIDPTKKPKTIDIYGKNDTDKLLVQGIYEIKDGIRKSCFAAPNKDRPDRFRTEKGFMTLEWRSDK